VVSEIVAGRYELEELCGIGGMSSVYRAYDRQLERRVALKILHERYVGDDEYVERFRREARAAAKLSHPNIVAVLDRGEDEGRQFIVYEYVHGENLKQRVARTGALPVSDVVRYGLAIARGLGFAHEHGLVHRDVKPQNVLVNGDGTAMVTDFGIARSLDVELGVTLTGTVLGTSGYISPEQANGRKVDERTDVYSLGVVLFELLTGNLPFDGDNFVTVAMRHVSEAPPAVLERRPDAPPRLAAALDRALAKDPAERIELDELVKELELTLAELDGSAADEDTLVGVPLSRPSPPSRPDSIRIWPPVLATLGAGLIAAALVGTQRARDELGARSSVAVEAISAHDPLGDDGAEHDAEAPRATDADPVSYWTTESYRYPNGGLGKPGVGLVLRASNPPRRLRVRTDTPGFTAEVRSGGRVVSARRRVENGTEFPIEDDGAGATELVLWITNRGPHSAVHVNEVTAT
jgi:eukaryotic-like serine/threonine-protein kinase